jgi:hypothetical protein
MGGTMVRRAAKRNGFRALLDGKTPAPASPAVRPESGDISSSSVRAGFADEPADADGEAAIEGLMAL